MGSLNNFLKFNTKYIKENGNLGFRLLLDRTDYIKKNKDSLDNEFKKSISYAIFISLIFFCNNYTSFRRFCFRRFLTLKEKLCHFCLYSNPNSRMNKSILTQHRKIEGFF